MSYTLVHNRATPNETSEVEDDISKHKIPHTGGKWLTIGFSLATATVPMFILSVALISLVFFFKVNTGQVPHPDLQPLGTQLDQSPLYVNLPATFLIFVASWSSSAAPICGGFLITLASYPICSVYLRSIENGLDYDLPTPHQLSLIIRFLNGGSFGALWSWLNYMLTWSKRQKAVAALRWISSITIFSILLGLLVFLADTWLHLATKSVNVFIFSDHPSAQYSFGLNSTFTRPDCQGRDAAVSCVVDIGVQTLYLERPEISQEVLANTSSLATVHTFVDTRGTFAYFSVPPSTEASSIDYTASTFGLQSQCRPVTTQCHIRFIATAAVPFNCSNSFSGDLTSYFQKEIIHGANANLSDKAGLTGPTYTSGVVGTTGAWNKITDELSNDDDIYGMSKNVKVIIMMCNTTTYDITLDMVNGTVVRLSAQRSNDTLLNLFAAPLKLGVGNENLELAATAAMIQSKSAVEVADIFASSYSTIALSIAAQTIEARPVLAGQRRDVLLLTKLQRAPLYALLAANLLFVLVGLVLAIWAIVAAKQPVHEIQTRLTIFGLAADRFEGQRARQAVKSMDCVFEEKATKRSRRVVIEPTGQGGYEYRLR